MQKTAKIYVAGHTGLLGSALLRKLREQGFFNLILAPHSELDLTQACAVFDFFSKTQPEYVLMAAGKVGGIVFNQTYPADFIRENLAMAQNVIEASHRYSVKRLLYFGSSCIYPRDCLQPIREEFLLSGPLEKTNEAYALAKIAGIQMCKAYNQQYQTRYLAIQPCNLYGPQDHYDSLKSHVIPALLKKIHEAKALDCAQVSLWGTGNAQREFLYSEDCAAACLRVLELSDVKFDLLLTANSYPILNVGSGETLSIRDLAQQIRDLIQYSGNLLWDSHQPEGTPMKSLESSRIRALGWSPRVALKVGLKEVYREMLLRFFPIHSSQ